MSRILVLAVGNPLRSDDGLAWHVADELRRNNLPPDVEIITIHQLAPELAENVSSADLVIFVDASSLGEPGTLSCEKIAPVPVESGSSHHFSPQALLELAAMLYGHPPAAYLVSIAGQNFDHGELLSPEVSKSIPSLVAKMRELIRSG